MAAKIIYSDIKLSIGILVSNRKDTIRKCMDSLVPLLRQVPSELIALDTVGEATDGSIAVVKEYTDKVYRYEWCKDFADARNTCLQHASGEWFLFLDDDEWFDHVDDLVEFFQSEDREQYGFGMFHIRNHTASGGYNTTLATRMIRRREDTHFIGRIHECFHEVHSEGKQFESFLHHSGYVFADEEAKRAHQQRNVSILQRELDENGMSPRRCAQMVQELMSCEETLRHGYEYCMFCLSELINDYATDSCTQWILAASVRYYHRIHDYEGLLKQVDKINNYGRLSQAAALAIYGAWVHAAVDVKDYSRIPSLAENYVEQYCWLKEHPEACMAQTQLDFPKYQEESYLEQVIQAGAITANALGQYDVAYRLWQHMPWNHLNNQGQQYQEYWLETLRGLPEKEPLEEYYKQRNEAVSMADDIIVSISLLVSNRKDTIRKCMESLKPLLDAVPSELIAVDTVGEENSDGSIAIVREYTDKIIHFPWCNDFAAARNAGLKQAKGKWFLTIDDDEWFEDITPIIKFFQEGDYKHYDRAWYNVRNYHDFEGTGWVDTFADRMCVITKDTKYEGRVHECLLPYPEKVMQFFCYAHHYGYVYENEEAARKHSERNITLLEQEVKERPEDARMTGQLVQEYAMAERYDDAVLMCENWLRTYKGQIMNPFAQFTTVMWLRILSVQNKQEDAEKLFRKLEEKRELKEVPWLACLVEGTPIEINLDKAEQALTHAEEYLNLKRKIRSKLETYAVQQVFDLKKYLEEDIEAQMVSFGIRAAIEAKEYRRAKVFFDCVNWSNTEQRPFDLMMLLVELYGKGGMEDVFCPYAEKIMQNPGMKKQFMVALENLIQEYPERKEAVVVWLNKQNEVASKKKLSPEMAQLVEALKENIQVLINEGRTAEAKMLLEELKKYV